MAMKKRRGRPKLTISYYIVQITDWDWSYSFGLNATTFDNRHYSDYRHLLVRGKVLLPSKLKVKTEAAELTFLPDIPPAELEQRGDPRPRAVGHLQVHKGLLTGGLSMATEALDAVMRMLLAGRLKYVVLDGEAMRYRQALIRHYQLVTQLDPEDYPDE